jgi:CTP-dependent riboflavin kinase
MNELLAGKVQAGFDEASRWLKFFDAAYSQKLGMPVFPGSLNIALDRVFNWFDARYEAQTIWFGRESTAASATYCRFPANWSVSIIGKPSRGHRRLRQGIDGIPGSSRSSLTVNLRNHFGLQDGDVVEIRVPITRVQG